MGNLCLGSREAVPEKVRSFLSGLASRTRRSETTLPDGSAIKVRGTPARLQARFPAACKCTSHLGFGFVCIEAGFPAGLFGMSWPLWRASSFPPQVGMVSLTMVPWRCWTFRRSGSASPYMVSRPDPDWTHNLRPGFLISVGVILTWMGGLRYDEVPPFRGVRARVIFAQHGQAGLVYIVWAQCGTPEGVGATLEPWEGWGRHDESGGCGPDSRGDAGAVWEEVRASASFARLVGHIEYHLVQVVLVLGVLLVELGAVLQAGRYLLLQGRVVRDPRVLRVGVHLHVWYARSSFTRSGMALRIFPT